MSNLSNNIYVLGLSCFYHDSAACVVKNGQVIAAAQEERFTRVKHDENFPERAIEFCLKYAGIKAKDLSLVAFYDKPLLKFERIVISHLNEFPKSLFPFILGMKEWLTKKLWTKALIYEKLAEYDGEIVFPEHHLSHAASAFLVSPFEQAAILTIDGVGEWATVTKGSGKGTGIKLTHQINYPHSLGLLYSAFTYYLGFKVNSAEYKVMGLAPYGVPRYAKKILDNLIDIKPDGSFNLNLKYFNYPHGLTMTNQRFNHLFGGEAKPLGTKPTQREMDLAASVQAVTDKVVVKMAQSLWKEYKISNLCMAGGVALNCVTNSQILRKTRFRQIFIQPAAGDAGGSLGAAILAYYDLMKKRGGKPIRKWRLENAYLGPEYSNLEIQKSLDNNRIKYLKLSTDQLIFRVARLIADQQVVGWFQDRMEFGPRALGNRSILADARNPNNQDRVNLKIKFRESFRPFAPSILEEESLKWFDLHALPDEYMLLVAHTKKNSIPAVTHVDGTARLQTVTKQTNEKYYKLINQFFQLSKTPVIINTSFNQRGEPIVCTPTDAILCFLRTDLDYLAIGNYLVDKTEVPRQVIESAKQMKFKRD